MRMFSQQQQQQDVAKQARIQKRATSNEDSDDDVDLEQEAGEAEDDSDTGMTDKEGVEDQEDFTKLKQLSKKQLANLLVATHGASQTYRRRADKLAAANKKIARQRGCPCS